MTLNYTFKNLSFLTFYVFTMFNSSSRKNEYNEMLFTNLLHNINLDKGYNRTNKTQYELKGDKLSNAE